jgi:Helix-turn-helix domain
VSNEELLTPKQAAALLGVAVNTLAIWRCKKRYSLRYIKVGANVRYRRGEIDRFLDERTVESPGVAVSRKRKA